MSKRTGSVLDGFVPDGRIPIYFVSHQVDHLPLALGMLRAALVAYHDGALLQRYQPLPIMALDPKGLQHLFQIFGPGVWLFSNYIWSFDYNRRISRLVKSVDPRNLTIHGGPSAPKYVDACRDFLKAEPHVDIVVRGEGEATLCELLEALVGKAAWGGLQAVPGLTYFRDRQRQDLLRTAERPRIRDLNGLPSAYLTDQFDRYGEDVVAAILETNRGCPFACTFCDWGSATAAKIHRFDMERVKAEIDWIGRSGIRVLWIADANFGIFARDVEIAQFIADTKARHGAPREVVVNYTKNATEKIAEVVKILASAGICGQGIISIQSTDSTTLKAIRRDNIKTEKYDELGDIFRRENLPLSTDLMIGLPGSTLSGFKVDLQRYFDDDVAVKAYRTQLLPNSPMADPEYIREHEIHTDAAGYLVSTSSYSRRDLHDMVGLWSAFDVADGYAVLRYALRYLQWDHDLPATDVLLSLIGAVRDDTSAFPLLSWMLTRFPLERRAPILGWSALYGQFARFASTRFGIKDTVAWKCILDFNAEMMPSCSRRFPQRLVLPHDVAAWFTAHNRRNSGNGRPLSEYPPGEISIADPYGMCENDHREIEQYDNHQVFFELESCVSRCRSPPNFVRSARVA